MGINSPAESERPSSRQGGPQALQPGYRFTIRSGLRALEAEPSKSVGPRGSRIHVIYDNGTIAMEEHRGSTAWWARRPDTYSDPHRFDLLYAAKGTGNGERETLKEAKRAWEQSGWTGLEGEVMAGADFLLIRPDGVIELDGRLTLCAKDETLIDASYAGLIDLDPTVHGDVASTGSEDVAQVSNAYQQFVEGTNPRREFPVELFMTFETSTGPWSTEDGEDSAWTKPSRDRHKGNVWKYRQLVRRQYLGIGKIQFRKLPNKLPQPHSIEIDIIEPAALYGAAK
jgi:uncharacterized protein DUF3237